MGTGCVESAPNRPDAVGTLFHRMGMGLSAKETMNSDDLVIGRLTDESIEMMRQRIGYPNPTLRAGIYDQPWHSVVSEDAVRQWALSIGDSNPLFTRPEYARATRWGGVIAPPGFEMATGWNRSPTMDPQFEKATSKALRGLQLFHSGGENFYWRPLEVSTSLYKSMWVEAVQEKESKFASRSVIVTNRLAWWDQQERTAVTGTDWFVHTERRTSGETSGKKGRDAPAFYTDEQLAEIEAAYDGEYVRGRDTLYLEDVKVGDRLPRMAKGPLTITDMINLHMGAGWLTYGNPPYRLAYENRKRLRGFYSRNEFNAWDTVQRVHWVAGLAGKVGVQGMYDIGPMRVTMLAHYLTNYAGDDGFVHRLRYEFWRFNYMGDTTWIEGTVTDVRNDPVLGPLLEIDLRGVNQRGEENIRGSATILVASTAHGPVKLPPQPAMTPHRRP